MEVKVTLILNASRITSFAIALLLFSPLPATAQVSEKEMQSIEKQELGVESSRTVDKAPEKKEAAPEDAESVYPASPSRPEDVQPQAEPEKIHPIDAEEFRVKVVKKSRSGRVLLFEDASENRPRPGKILLIKRDADDVVAVRVLKNMNGKFAGKIVLNFTEPEMEREYRALKKLGDKLIAMIKEREKRGKDLDAAKTDEELAREVEPDDNELDRGIPASDQKGGKAHKMKGGPGGSTGPGETEKKTPEPLFNKDGTEIGADSIEVSDEEEPMADLSVQEELPIEPHRHAVSAEYGMLRNVDSSNNPATYNGFGIRYAFTFWRMPMLRKRTLQDSFTLELGAFYYAINGFLTSTDSITVIPVIGTVRYGLVVGENLMFYPYAGVIRNNISVSQGALSSNTLLLATTKAAVGAGAMLKLGPSWAARLDLGTDLFGVGSVLKF